MKGEVEVGKTINEIRKSCGLEEIEGGDNVKINEIKMCNDRCENYLVIKYERLTSNNICSCCISKDTDKVKELIEENKKIEGYIKEVQEVLDEV